MAPSCPPLWVLALAAGVLPAAGADWDAAGGLAAETEPTEAIDMTNNPYLLWLWESCHYAARPICAMGTLAFGPDIRCIRTFDQ
jgi:hypothetical protein